MVGNSLTYGFWLNDCYMKIHLHECLGVIAKVVNSSCLIQVHNKSGKQVLYLLSFDNARTFKSIF